MAVIYHLLFWALIFENNILPNNTNIQNIGDSANKWGTIYANDIIVDGANITNINFTDKTTDNLKETENNRYYKKQYFENDLYDKLINTKNITNKITLDNIEDGEKAKKITNDNYKGTLIVDNIIINNYDPTNEGFNIIYDIIYYYV